MSGRIDGLGEDDMKPTFLLLMSCLLVVVLRGPARGDMRTWTDHTGTRTIEAEYIHGDENHVRLLLKNGKKLTVRISQLSAGDQQFVREIMAGKPTTLAVSEEAATAGTSVVGSPSAASTAAQEPTPNKGPGEIQSSESDWAPLIDSS